jgi:hypothetical protein
MVVTNGKTHGKWNTNSKMKHRLRLNSTNRKTSEIRNHKQKQKRLTPSRVLLPGGPNLRSWSHLSTNCFLTTSSHPLFSTFSLPFASKPLLMTWARTPNSKCEAITCAEFLDDLLNPTALNLFYASYAERKSNRWKMTGIQLRTPLASCFFHCRCPRGF